MKNNSHIVLLLFALALMTQSCVQSIDIDAEDESTLELRCEITVDKQLIQARLLTTDNLNGSKPITNPDDAQVEISTGTETKVNLFYNEEKGLYENDNISVEWWKVNMLTITAKVPDSNMPEIYAESEKLRANQIASISSSEPISVDVEGEEYYERELTIELEEPKSRPAYYELILNERLTTTSIGIDGEKIYDDQDDVKAISEFTVVQGGSGLVPMNHREGILIDHSRLQDNTFVITVRSAHQQMLEYQEFAVLDIILSSVSKVHYDFQKAESNNFKTGDGQFSDKPIYSNNVENGFGLFSLRTNSTSQIIFE